MGECPVHLSRLLRRPHRHPHRRAVVPSSRGAQLLRQHDLRGIGRAAQCDGELRQERPEPVQRVPAIHLHGRSVAPLLPHFHCGHRLLRGLADRAHNGRRLVHPRLTSDDWLPVRGAGLARLGTHRVLALARRKPCGGLRGDRKPGRNPLGAPDRGPVVDPGRVRRLPGSLWRRRVPGSPYGSVRHGPRADTRRSPGLDEPERRRQFPLLLPRP